ncbi:ATP-NAD kinase family protein [Azospirillum picis]|uniref:Polyphosphate/ATP-dependent NAD kinase n=1 Tax=Azospirillum picis TaxID=488438 RepID=A0ABU0MEV6_9PROT|nr:NAD(+)/NADH kinase [Azospirillum picis]MBP2298124.1 putative polyphosphate/ATP-dependent NAD kinase [Azospirillum picis]MDQ0531962.1 putative polyphosphate/ATP-dependent NAD kinase [Azospirillum picis]
MAPVVGIVANPVSARDIRRVVANATSLQIADRANILLRVLAALRACGVQDVLMMPENGGIRAHVERGVMRAKSRGEDIYPSLHPVAMPVTGTVADTHRATVEMRRAGVAALVVLGGDGTHRAVAADCGTVPIAGISTGTNNAFPEHREPTITGLATGLAVTGRVPPHIAFAANKRIDVSLINGANGGAVTDLALVDVALVTERYIGARALWRTENFRELYVTFADPEVIGMSAIAGLLEPVGRDESGGLMVRLSADGDGAGEGRRGTTTLHAPIAPGMMARVGVTDWRRMPADVAFVPEVAAGSIALDGERELSFTERDRLSLTLRDGAFRTVNVAAVMRHAGQNRLLTATPVPATAF